MTQPSDLIWATIVQGPDPIPAEWAIYVGRIVGLPQDSMLAISTDANVPSNVRGLFAYRRTVTTGTGAEIVLVPKISNAVRSYIAGKPAPLAWAAGDEAQVTQVIEALLFDFHLTTAQAQIVLDTLFDTARRVA